jgi:hypothetical protein
MESSDIEKLKAEIKAEILKEITGQPLKPDRCGVFDEVRNRYKKPLFETYGTYHWDRVWSFIRQLSCYMAGVRYVRELSPSAEIKAAAVAEKLCKMAIKREVDV